MLGIMISILCIYLAFDKVDINGTFRILTKFGYQWLVIGAILGVFKLQIMTVRWIYIIPDSSSKSFSNLFDAYLIGNMSNMIFPLRIGDLIRTYLGALWCKQKIAVYLGTLASEHLLDFLVLIVLFYGILVFNPIIFPNWIISTLFYLTLFSLFFIGVLRLMMSNKFLPSTKPRVFQLILSHEIILSFFRLLKEFSVGFLQFKSKRRIAIIGLFTLLIWLLQFLWVFLLLFAFNLFDLNLVGLKASLILMVAIGLAVIIPSSPSYLGTLHLIVVLVMEKMNISREAALSYAIVSHAHGTLVSIMLGLYSLWKRKFMGKYNGLVKELSERKLSEELSSVN